MPNDIETLILMHRLKRPAGSEAELEFIKTYIEPLGTSVDKHGNHWIEVGDDRPDILWSSHTDTVHRVGGTQRLLFDGTLLKLHPKSQSSCLGADCTAGVWLMIEMIKAGVPGFYIFHAEEEIGQIGADGFAADNPEYLKNFRAAIAFDRKGNDSVITRMMGLRTCSDAFADSIITQIPGYKRDSYGSVTDTYSYKRLIPECTNMSVGYSGAHTFQESLNVHDLIALRDMMIKFDASKLVIERDPAAKDDWRSTSRYYGNYDTNPYPKGTHANLVYGETARVIGRALEGVMTFDEFEALVKKARDEDSAEIGIRCRSKFSATDPDGDAFDGWPDTTGTCGITGGVSTKALQQYGPGMSGTPPPVTKPIAHGNSNVVPMTPLPATASRHRIKSRTMVRGTEKV